MIALATEDLRGLSDPQRRAVVVGLVGALRADGRATREEIIALMTMLSLAFSEPEANAYLQEAEARVAALRSEQDLFELGKACGETLSAPQLRDRVVTTMLAIAFADNVFVPSEHQFLGVFAMGLGLSPERFDALCDAAADRNIFAATVRGRVDAVRALLDAGVPVNARDPRQWTPLHLAVSRGEAAIVELLLERGADVHARHGDNSPPLFTACNKPYEQIVERLLRAGARHDDRGNGGLMAIHLAAMCGQAGVVRALLAGGADIDAADDRGATALAFAAAEGRTEALTVLLDANARLDAGDCDGVTPLHRAAENQPAALAILLARGGVAGMGSSTGITPLHYAARGGFTECARLLLDAGAPVDARATDTSTPLYVAAIHDRKDVYDLLVFGGADPEANVAGGTPRGSMGKAKTLVLRATPLPDKPPAQADAEGDARDLERALATVPLSPDAAGLVARFADFQIAAWAREDGSPDQVLVAGHDARGRPEYVSRTPRDETTDPRGRFLVVASGPRRWLPIFTSDAAARSFRERVRIGWPEDGSGVAAAVIGGVTPAMFRIADLPVDGVIVNPCGPGGPRVLSHEECDRIVRRI